ncbi:hypothetical protein K439DRAFT_1642236 [Ramaria rubella]|nr:hypothetical protein K439DRAFT_1642236 [Ramaria rubella]
MQLFSLDLSLPIFLAIFSLCTSMLAVLGTVQLVVSAPQSGHLQNAHRQSHDPAALEVGLGMYKRVTPWWTAVSSANPGVVPLGSRPPLSMAKLIMFRHAESQRRANARARTRFYQPVC